MLNQGDEELFKCSRASQLLEVCVSESPHPFLTPALNCALLLLPTSQRVGVFPTSYFPSHRNMHLLKCQREAPISTLVALCSAKYCISNSVFPCPQMRWVCAMIHYNCRCLSCPPASKSSLWTLVLSSAPDVICLHSYKGIWMQK